MSSDLRKEAIASISNVPKNVNIDERAATEFYGEDVFGYSVMQKLLPKAVYKSLINTIHNGQPLQLDVADAVAEAMKRWALSKGVSHYTHWFQPLTGTTAEKHDSFIEPSENSIIMNFSGKNLIQGEPDASSFPSGGIRATFEARGYTAWDPTSPAFIKRTENGATLCIPTAFCSYTGEALDKKTPLLRSLNALRTHAERLMACFSDTPDQISTSLGIEQEYFLVDRKFFNLREDLMLCGRTLFGNVPPKHQQLEDHYFGSIKPRILEFMTEVDQALWRLGIPAKTRHNEVAPGQFEVAPIFEELNLALDHNMLVMEVLRKIADHHGFVCILHEKPFKGVNGSGKHNNWSLSSKNFGNLLNPGKNPHQNAVFLTVLCCVIAAIDKHADLLRATVANIGNDSRLGAAEAPPAIISIFLGELLTDVINQIEKGAAKSSKQQGQMHIGVDTLPVLPKDTSDRNRTSPFAFTNNKFEFRAVGSSQNSSWPVTILNTIVAETLDEVATALEPFAGKTNFNKELQKLLQSIVKKHKRIIFNGDGYTDEWVKEAKKRGLPNIPSSLDALKVLVMPENIALFEKYKVLNEVEMKARYEVYVENYTKRLIIEVDTAIQMVETQLMPVVISQLNALANTLDSMNSCGLTAGTFTIEQRAIQMGELLDQVPSCISLLNKAKKTENIPVIKKQLETLRTIIDTLESITDDDIWPMPKYLDMLFMY